MLVQPLWRSVWRLLKILKIESPCDPAVETWTPIFIAVLFTVAKTWKQPVSVDRNGERRCDIYIYIYTHRHTQWDITAVRKNEMMPFIAS